MYNREVVSVDIEKDIVVGLIVSHEFCREAFRMIRPEHFKSKYLRRVMFWVSEYFKKYKEAPLTKIEKIYKSEGRKLSQDEADLIEVLLDDISDRYVDQLETGDGTYNHPYYLEEARKYIKTRNVDLLINDLDNYIIKGQIDKADAAIRNFSQAMAETSGWFSPFKKEAIQKVFDEDITNRLFKLPGLLGEMVGYLERTWLVAYFGPMKRGKSWYLENLAVAALTSKLKVVYISLEMSAKQVSKRLYAMLTAAGKYEGLVLIPVFDCQRNQDGTCQREDRTNDIILCNGEAVETPVYDETNQDHRNYKVCTHCRAKRLPDYIPATWWQMKMSDELTPKNVKKKVERFTKMYQDNLRVIAYPPYSIDLDHIIDEINDLQFTEDFVPDVICIDYLDITAAGVEAKLSERGQVDARWKKAKGLGVEKNCLVATVSQTGRASFLKENIDETDTSEDIRKLANLDLAMGLNQTVEDKRKGIMRINRLAFRHDDFDIRQQVMCLQALKVGQPIMDTEYDPKTYKVFHGTIERPRNRQNQNNNRRRYNV